MQKIEAGDDLAQSVDGFAANLQKLKSLFPELITEGPEGASVNVDVLKGLVGDLTVTDAQEKYGLSWHGKRKARQLALTPSLGTLRPCKDESVDWDTTQNLMIEGDNLEVLKLLQKSYAGKVKLIYIDPPYNTGKDFVYPDDFQDNIKNYLELTGQVEGGRKISSNPETSGRFHTDWLNMMYPRLKLARDLLKNEGLIAISVDDGEVATLKLLCAEIFGEENFVACITWQKSYSPANDKKGVDAMHDFILLYRKSEASQVNLFPRTAKQDDAYTNLDGDPRGPWKAVDATRAEHRDYAFFEIPTPSGRSVWPASGRSWVFTKGELPGLLADRRLWFGKDGSSKPSKKLFLTEVKQGVVPTTWWTHEDAGHNDEAKKELKSLVTDGVPFQTPKPTRLIQRLLVMATSPKAGDLILDFFAGSGTTGHATWALNSADGGDRRYILVQLPEPTDDKKYPKISAITAQRLRASAAKEGRGARLLHGDLGFRVFKLDSTNIRAWDPKPADAAEAIQQSLDHLKADRSDEDILYEIMLKHGLDLALPIAEREMAGKRVFSVGAGTVLACLERRIAREEVEPLALGMLQWIKDLWPAEEDRSRERLCIFRDSAFADDVAKTNLAEILKQHGLTNVRSV